VQKIGMAIGAGLAAALLFVIETKGTPLAIVLANFASLPLFIVALGWGLDMGALAGAVASLGAGLLLAPIAGGEFALALALPVWLLCLACQQPGRRAAGAAEPAWRPIGSIVTVAVAIGFLAGVAGLVTLTVLPGGYAKNVEDLAVEFTRVLNDNFDGAMTPGTVADIAAMATRIWPAVLAVQTMLMLCLNLYAGARSVQMSQRLARPWVDLPEALHLPQGLAACLALCVGAALTLPVPINQVGWIGAGVLGAAYVLQGLAVVHAISRGLRIRAPMLAGLYLGCLVTALWSLPALAIVGIAESLLSLRARAAAAKIRP